jgi:hypothetical protein
MTAEAGSALLAAVLRRRSESGKCMVRYARTAGAAQLELSPEQILQHIAIETVGEWLRTAQRAVEQRGRPRHSHDSERGKM